VGNFVRKKEMAASAACNSGGYFHSEQTPLRFKLGLAQNSPSHSRGPPQVLSQLLENPGDLMTWEQLRSRFWASDTCVDFDRGLKAAIKRLRDALGDSVEDPTFVETVCSEKLCAGREFYRARLGQVPMEVFPNQVGYGLLRATKKLQHLQRK
jgi:hypothetical protein